MMARMLSQLPLPLLPAGTAEIAPGVGFAAGDEGGLVIVHGLVMPLTEGPQGRSSKFPTWLTLSLLRLVTDCHGPCRRVAVAL
jgi:hypothetical protein